MTAPRVVGQSLLKVDGVKLVTGQASFTDDLTLPGQLYGEVLGSPHPHALIEEIDVSEAKRLPGVHTVLTYRDVPRVPHTTAGQLFPEPSPYDKFMLDRKLRHVGDRVAAVAAETPELARQALELIRVKYRVLPAVLDLEQAMAPGAPIVHDEPESTGIKDRSRNLLAVIQVEIGDVERGYREADAIVEEVYRVPRIQQSSIEPHITLTYLDEDQRLVVRTSTQVPFHTRRTLARVLQIPEGRIRVIKPSVGGGFGGKQEMVLEDICSALTLAAKRPVRLELRRHQEFTMARSRHSQVLRLKTGVKRDGRITANFMKVLGDTGAYGTHGPSVQTNTGVYPLALYHSDHVKFYCEVVYTNLPPAGAMRGYGVPQGGFAMECQMDQAAEAIGMDPLEFRERNRIREGEVDPMSRKMTEGGKAKPRVVRTDGFGLALKKGAEAFGWRGRRRGSPAQGSLRRGRGMACTMQGSGIAGVDWAGATLKQNEDGSFNLLAGAADIGTGANTVLAQIAAETLGTHLEKILVYAADTDRTPFDTGAYASSTTYVSGGAVKRVAEEVRGQILEVAAKLLETDVGNVRLEDGQALGPGGTRVSLEEVAREAYYGVKRQIGATTSFLCPESPPPFAAEFAEVEVDAETGEVRVLRLVAAVDCGFAINPILAEGQVEGAVSMGLGYGLSEAILYGKDGAPLNTTFLDYKLFTSKDMPQLETLLVETQEPTGPYGAKAVGEIATSAPAPAIANAIYDAVGVRIRDIPITPEKVLRALKEKRGAAR